MIKRAWRAALFDRKAHGEVLFDSSATADAALLVVVVALAVSVVGSLGSISLFDVTVWLSAIISGLAGWLFLAVATWFVGTRLFQGSGDMQTVMRLQGFCALPLLLGAAAGIHVLLPLVGALWYVGATVVATAVALGVSTRNAALSVLAGAAVVALVGAVFRFPFLLLGGLF
jgi:hypothetical protein